MHATGRVKYVLFANIKLYQMLPAQVFMGNISKKFYIKIRLSLLFVLHFAEQNK